MSHNPQQRPISPPGTPAATNGHAPPNGHVHGARPLPVSNRPLPAKGGAPIPLVRGQAMPRDAANQGDEEQEPVSLQSWANKSPPWLVSGVVHMLLLVILGLMFIAHGQEELEIISNWAEDYGDPLAEDGMNIESLKPTDSKILAESQLPPVADPFSAPQKLEVNSLIGATATASDLVAPAIGNHLSGRMEGSRDAMLKRFGGDRLSEAAVANALAWLAKQQGDDGSWSLSGPFDAGVQPQERVAATAMAMLAFQGNGHTHKQGKYKERLLKAKDWMISRQQDDGSWRADSGHHRLYMQGQATIAICELYGMTSDPSLKEPAEKAANYCIKSQSKLGGWRYNPADQDADVSVTGWVLMGLQSAKMAKIDVPDGVFARVGKFLDDCSPDGGRLYCYLSKTDQPTQAMTGEALMCRQWLGWRRDNKQLQGGIDYLVSAENLPRWERWDDLSNRGRDVYYWYYATQAIHHFGGPSWEKWNNVMKPMLVKSQVKAGSREAGSWDPDGDKWGQFGGRLYVTCLSTYILEVYYRHLPLYDTKH
jgi:hypothetical protein